MTETDDIQSAIKRYSLHYFSEQCCLALSQTVLVYSEVNIFLILQMYWYSQSSVKITTEDQQYIEEVGSTKSLDFSGVGQIPLHAIMHNT